MKVYQGGIDRIVVTFGIHDKLPLVVIRTAKLLSSDNG